MVNLYQGGTTLDKIKNIDLKYVEAYPGQEIGNGIEGTMHYEMDADTRKQGKELLDSKGIELVAYGVVSGQNEQDWRNLLEFAQDMGIGIINSGPAPEDLDMVNRLAGEYNITVALHNHPDTVLVQVGIIQQINLNYLLFADIGARQDKVCVALR